jgi:hypothetical protein
VRQCHNKKENEESYSTEAVQEATTLTSREPDFLLKATTRNILAMTVEHVFDPEKDVKGLLRELFALFVALLSKRSHRCTFMNK